LASVIHSPGFVGVFPEERSFGHLEKFFNPCRFAFPRSCVQNDVRAMRTEVLRVDSTDPQPEVIARAAAVLKNGGLVAFPTETVYGLGASAFDAAAVARIFAAKGRPANNPLIVHFARLPFQDADSPPREHWPASADRLAARFWPGPLTLVLRKPVEVPQIVTAGGPTWGVRMPDHAVAHALIAASGPLAAPSANVSSGVSPTTAEHVLQSLDGRIDLVLDGGSCPGGIESTVLDLTTSPPRVLRPGPIMPSKLRAVIGEVNSPQIRLSEEHESLPSPGTSIRHYAPRARLECYSDPELAICRALELAGLGMPLRWFCRGSPPNPDLDQVQTVQMPLESAGYAAQLYGALHEADRSAAEYIVLELPPDEEEWLAVRDRLRRGATIWNS
jgi:L-threonylcarbamoyladenylate synthase